MKNPKYMTIRNDILNKILRKELAINNRIPSEIEMSELYNVSRHTIRQALSELVNEGYLIKVQGSGTYVSDLYKKKNIKKIRTIGVITTYLSDYIFPSIIRGIEKELSEYNYSLMLASTHNDVKEERLNLEKMLANNVDGLIIEPTKSNLLNPNLNYYLNLSSSGIPLLMLHATYDELKLPYIAMDDEGAGKKATNHLIDLGHKKIAMITKTDDLQGKNRLSGYIKALQAAGMSYENDHIILYETENRDNLSREIDKLITSKNPPTAIICYNDQIAVKVIEQIEKIDKKIPDDFSIVSHDDSHLSTSFNGVKLTTIEHPKDKMGKDAAKWILNAVKNPTFEQKSIVYTPKLIVRDSTKTIKEDPNVERNTANA